MSTVEHRTRIEGMAPVGSVRPQQAGPGAQALRQPARRRRAAGAADGARRLHAPPGRREHLGRAVDRHHRQRARRQGRASSTRRPTRSTATRPSTRSRTKWGTCDGRALPFPTDYLLHLADNALVLGQRNAEWCGHGPILEEDIALANISLDLIGQARLLYQHASPAAKGQAMRTEDTLAYFRDVRRVPQLHPAGAAAPRPAGRLPARADRDYATTIVRNFLYSALMVLLWERLQASTDAQLAAIAAKSLKEVRYHLRHSRDWLVRLGDGTDESHARAQAALDHLMPYTPEFWTASPAETAAAGPGTGVDVADAARRLERPGRRRAGRGHAAAPGRPAAMSPKASRACTPSTWASCSPRCRAWRAPTRAPPGDRRPCTDEHPSRHAFVHASRGLGRAGPADRPGDSGDLAARARHPARGATRRRRRAEVVITPTYSGCPAMGQIEDDVRAALRSRRHAGARRHAAGAGLDHRLDERRRPGEAARLRHRAAAVRQPCARWRPAVVRFAGRPPSATAVPCPQCGSANTTETSHFGSTACKALYSCLDCLEPFDYFKPY